MWYQRCRRHHDYHGDKLHHSDKRKGQDNSADQRPFRVSLEAHPLIYRIRTYSNKQVLEIKWTQQPKRINDHLVTWICYFSAAWKVLDGRVKGLYLWQLSTVLTRHVLRRTLILLFLLYFERLFWLLIRRTTLPRMQLFSRTHFRVRLNPTPFPPPSLLLPFLLRLDLLLNQRLHRGILKVPSADGLPDRLSLIISEKPLTIP